MDILKWNLFRASAIRALELIAQLDAATHSDQDNNAAQSTESKENGGEHEKSEDDHCIQDGDCILDEVESMDLTLSFLDQHVYESLCQVQ